MPKLSGRIEEFCHKMLISSSQTAAARESGYSLKSAANKASDLMRRPEVIDRIKELRDKQDRALIKANIADIKERQERLTELVRNDVKTDVSSMDVTRAIAELNKMDGSYAPEKHAVLGDILIKVVYDNKDD